MFGLEKKHFDFILSVLKKYAPEAKYFVFGSRAKDNYGKYSDIDIALDFNNDIIPIEILDKIRLEFNNSTLPIEVDIVDLNAIDENFKEIIKESLVEIKNPLK